MTIQYYQMEKNEYKQQQRNQVICLLGFGMYVGIMLIVLSFVPAPFSFIFNNIWFLAVPLIPAIVFVAWAIKGANRKYK